MVKVRYLYSFLYFVLVTPYLGADAKDDGGVNASCRRREGMISSQTEGAPPEASAIVSCKEPSAPVSQFLAADLVRGHVAIE